VLFSEIEGVIQTIRQTILEETMYTKTTQATASAAAAQKAVATAAFVPGFKPRVAVPQESSNDPYPVKMTFLNGSRALKQLGGPNYLGGFFIGLDKLPDDFEPPVGFAADEHTFSDGAKMGFMAQSAEVSILLARRRWDAPNGDDSTYLPWQSQIKGIAGVRGNIQALVGVKGANYPMVMSFKGKTLGIALDEVLKAGKVLAQKANEILPQGEVPWPSFMFHIPLTSLASLDPATGFVEAKGANGSSSVVTPLTVHPTLATIQVPNVTAETLQKFYVGDAAFEQYQTWVEEAMALGWHTAWDAKQTATTEASK